jgi:hypothetical protein
MPLTTPILYCCCLTSLCGCADVAKNKSTNTQTNYRNSLSLHLRRLKFQAKWNLERVKLLRSSARCSSFFRFYWGETRRQNSPLTSLTSEWRHGVAGLIWF